MSISMILVADVVMVDTPVSKEYQTFEQVVGHEVTWISKSMRVVPVAKTTPTFEVLDTVTTVSVRFAALSGTPRE